MSRPALTRSLLTLCAVLPLAVGCGEASRQPPAFVAPESARPIAQTRPAAPAPDSTSERSASQAASVLPAAFSVTNSNAPANVPTVLLTRQHEALCRVKVGDPLPDAELPNLAGGKARLSDLRGKAATVVVFWKSDRRMTWDQLADLGPDVVQPFGPKGVAVVGIAVQEPAARARDIVRSTGAEFPQLLDADGKAFAQVGAERLPWSLVLDPSGKIVWFDLEYSHATRRELQQALLALTR